MSVLSNLPFEKKIALTIKICDDVVAIIEKYGPLSFEGVYNFLLKESENWIAQSDARYAIAVNKEEKLRENQKDFLIRLSSKPDEVPRVPSPSDYVSAYYDLYYMLTLIKKDPDLINLPETWWNKLL